MNNNLMTNNQNNQDNEELMKENTPETVDYDKLYNINNNNISETNINNAIDFTPNNLENNINQEIIDNKNSNDNGKKDISSILFVIAIFLMLMVIVLFIFPFLSKLILE